MGRRSPLSDADIDLIREAAELREFYRREALKLSNAALAQKFNVSPTTISSVINRYYSYTGAVISRQG